MKPWGDYDMRDKKVGARVRRNCRTTEIAEVPLEEVERLKIIATELVDAGILAGTITVEDDLDACREDVLTDLIWEWADDTHAFKVYDRDTKSIDIDIL